MAWSAALLDGDFSSVNAQQYLTNVVSPTADRLLVVCVASSANPPNPTGAHTVTGLSLSWAQVTSQFYNGNDESNVSMWVALTGATPGSGKLTIDVGGSSNLRCLWSITEVELDGALPANAIDAVVQYEESRDDSGDETETVTLPAGMTGGNVAFACYGEANGNATGSSVEAGWTELDALIDRENHNLITVWRNGDTDNSVTLGTTGGVGGSIGEAALIMELGASASGPTAGADPTVAMAPTEARTDIAFGDSPNNLSTYIHRSTSQGFTPGVGTRHTGNIGANETSHTDTDTVAADTIYYYVVEWENASGSTYSAEVAITTAPAIPTAFAFTPAAESIEFTLTRAAGSTDNTHYVTVTDSLGAFITTIQLDVGDVTATVLGLTQDETYTFRAQAYDAAANGGLGAYSTFYTDTQATLTTETVVSVGQALETASAFNLSWSTTAPAIYTRYDGVDATDRMVAADLVDPQDVIDTTIQRGTATGGSVTFPSSFSAAPIVVAVPEVT